MVLHGSSRQSNIKHNWTYDPGFMPGIYDKRLNLHFFMAVMRHVTIQFKGLKMENGSNAAF